MVTKLFSIFIKQIYINTVFRFLLLSIEWYPKIRTGCSIVIKYIPPVKLIACNFKRGCNSDSVFDGL
jgi:hypothetical protein